MTVAFILTSWVLNVLREVDTLLVVLENFLIATGVAVLVWLIRPVENQKD